MPAKCSVAGCRSYQKAGTGIQMFHFPLKDEKRCAFWVEAVGKQNWKPSKSSVVCGLHFKESDYLVRPGTYIKHLNQYAVPATADQTTTQCKVNNLPSSSETKCTNSSNKIQKNLPPPREATESLTTKETQVVLQLKNKPKTEEIPKRVERTIAPFENHNYARKPEEELASTSSRIVYIYGSMFCPVMNNEALKPTLKQEHIDNDRLEKVQLRRKIKTLNQTIRRQREKINCLKILLQKLCRHKLSKEDTKLLLLDEAM